MPPVAALHRYPVKGFTPECPESLHITAEGRVAGEVRFRSNVAIDGLAPFEEQAWMGRMLRVGAVRFRVHIPIRRCLATHAHPETGERDLPILTTLTRSFAQDEPTLAIGLVPVGPGEIRRGDELALEAVEAHRLRALQNLSTYRPLPWGRARQGLR